MTGISKTFPKLIWPFIILNKWNMIQYYSISKQDFLVENVICVKVNIHQFESYFKKKNIHNFWTKFWKSGLCGGERKIRGSYKGRPLLLTFPGRKKRKRNDLKTCNFLFIFNSLKRLNTQWYRLLCIPFKTLFKQNPKFLK